MGRVASQSQTCSCTGHVVAAFGTRSKLPRLVLYRQMVCCRGEHACANGHRIHTTFAHAYRGGCMAPVRLPAHPPARR
eukprot:360045-Chlamydomonas_euryale.AAC.9